MEKEIDVGVLVYTYRKWERRFQDGNPITTHEVQAVQNDFSKKYSHQEAIDIYNRTVSEVAREMMNGL